jgi:hypothetical protein|tara:strand:- start:2125 stop:2286 length:162 start_codon:yes stop_codon:yes gene_type:complete
LKAQIVLLDAIEDVKAAPGRAVEAAASAVSNSLESAQGDAQERIRRVKQQLGE